MSKTEQTGSELHKLSEKEVRQVPEYLDEFIENESEFAPKFENSIQRSERDIDAERPARMREPKVS